ncbi:LIM domain and actin-binding protein 1 [Clydaea vesicula]|uniref:LIM domain and actin-binding protein 1 n=1 Tax=Clydaea vesicula TaxID=447962 RepID=A0AAD5U280_9FUNG|nr:LIM domain and actin-binding protein 1 [Clydaea vesicula]
MAEVIKSSDSNGDLKKIQDSCTVCNKIVYNMDRASADDKVFHKSCLKCGHCKKILSLGNYAALNGVMYCKPHFKQLFALKGNYSDGFKKEGEGNTSSTSFSYIAKPGTNFNNVGGSSSVPSSANSSLRGNNPLLTRNKVAELPQTSTQQEQSIVAAKLSDRMTAFQREENSTTAKSISSSSQNVEQSESFATTTTSSISKSSNEDSYVELLKLKDEEINKLKSELEHLKFKLENLEDILKEKDAMLEQKDEQLENLKNIDSHTI